MNVATDATSTLGVVRVDKKVKAVVGCFSVVRSELTAGCDDAVGFSGILPALLNT